MRFDRRSRLSAASRRQDQARIVRLIGLLVLVVLLIQVASRPSAWNWLVALSEPQEAVRPPEAAAGRPAVQVRRPADQPQLPDDEVYARVAEPGDSEAEASPDAAPEPAAGVRGGGPLLPAELFDGVQDDWFGLTRAEQPALIGISRALRDVESEQWSAAADRNATFDVLLNMPEVYRGRGVTISGTLRRLLPAELHHDSDVVRLWEAYVIANDARATPYIILSNEPPAGITPGDDLEARVSVDACYVRRIAYGTPRGEAVTSLLMAPTIRWTPLTTPGPEEVRREMGYGVIVFTGGVALVLIGVLAWFFVSDRRFRRSRMHQIAESRLDAAPEALSALDALDGGDPHQIRIEEPQESPAGRT